MKALRKCSFAVISLFFLLFLFIFVQQFANAQGAATGDLRVSVKDPIPRATS